MNLNPAAALFPPATKRTHAKESPYLPHPCRLRRVKEGDRLFPGRSCQISKAPRPNTWGPAIRSPRVAKPDTIRTPLLAVRTIATSIPARIEAVFQGACG